jgi:hypothetical protein
MRERGLGMGVEEGTKPSSAQPTRERAGEVGRRPRAREVKLADRYHFMTVRTGIISLTLLLRRNPFSGW